MSLDLILQIAIPVVGFVAGLFGNKLLPGGSTPATPAPNAPGFDLADGQAILAAIAEKFRQVRGGAVLPGQSHRPILDALTKLFRDDAAPIIPDGVLNVPSVPNANLDDLIRRIADAVANRLKPS